MPKIGQTSVNTRPKPFCPYWQTTDKKTVRLYLGHVADVLAQMPEQSVHCCVTSPPYWGLRDYGTGTWAGGNLMCDHIRQKEQRTRMNLAQWSSKNATSGGHAVTQSIQFHLPGPRQYNGACAKCGATRIDQQLGSEPSPDCGSQGQAQCGRCFVCAMIAVFRQVRRVLRDDGTMWLNLGDTYVGSGDMMGTAIVGCSKNNKALQEQYDKMSGDTMRLSAGNLVGIPWRVALALQADGWILRQDIIWHKPSPIPESVRSRCTKSHEYIFLLAKRMGYYYDAEAVKEVAVQKPQRRSAGATNRAVSFSTEDYNTGNRGARDEPDVDGDGRSNKRSVWRVPSQGYQGAHFATFPPKLIEPCILAGTSERGCCAECGAPWKRVVEQRKLTRERPNDYVKRTGEEGTGNSCANSVAGVETRTIGWEPTCKCVLGDRLVPCVVLDPFIGSGTTCCVSLGHGRHSIGIDLSEKYLRNNAIPRIEGDLLSRSEFARLAPSTTAIHKVHEMGRSAIRKP